MAKILLGLNAEKIDENIASNFEGVGLIRSEYLCRNIGKYVTTQECKKYIYTYVEEMCKTFRAKEVWYRFTDLTPNEISTLEGCDYNMIEKYHFIGAKGVRRHLMFEDTFKYECEILKLINEKYDNIGVIIPYIKDIEEYKKIKKLIRDIGYTGKIGIMAEIPSIIFEIEKIINEGVDNITIGLNDLTSLMLGTYRESQYHQKLHPIIVQVVEKINKICIEKDIDFSIAGYFTKEEIEFYRNMKDLKGITINYTNLPNLQYKYDNLPELDLIKKIKKDTKERRKVIESK